MLCRIVASRFGMIECSGTVGESVIYCLCLCFCFLEESCLALGFGLEALRDREVAKKGDDPLG